VLLQVLFHARIAEDALELPFGIDDVAGALVRKLGNRVPAVLAGEAISLEEQLAQWEERKATESSVKARVSTVDDVPTAQPALALTQKVYERVAAAGLPVDLIPEGLLTIGVALGGDAENALRTQTLEFMDTVRKVEQNIIASRRNPDVPEELDSAPLGVVTEDEWRAHWPTGERGDERPDVDEGSSEPEESDEDEDEDGDPKAVVEEPDPQSEGVDEVADEPDLVDQDSSVEPQ
jgi:XTP/dITP diphosphohydrolase